MEFNRSTQLPGQPERSPFFQVLSKRVLHRHADKGWTGLVERVVALAAQAEAMWREEDEALFLEELRAALTAGEFLPNSPLLVNAAEPQRRLFACFALDARQDVACFLETASKVHDGMGGVGYTLDMYRDSASVADFIRQVDEYTVAHQEGRLRPASNAATVDIGHPGAEAILQLAGQMKVTNLNLGVSDSFMAAVDQGTLQARELLQRLVRSIHATGQPGVVFTDRIRRVARDPAAPFATNVCGEAPLAADESSLLGSINLVQLVERSPSGAFWLDEARLIRLARMGVRFLDGMHDIHNHPSEQLRINSLATRKLGVGVMGFAHMLALLGMRYGEPASIQQAERISSLLMQAAAAESERLAAIRGAYPAWAEGRGLPQRRNASLVAIAGTATLALLVGTTGGIEPVFGRVSRYTVMGEPLELVDPLVSFLASQQGLGEEQVRRAMLGEPSLHEVAAELAWLVPTAHEVPGEAHIRIQAAFQRHIDGGITKTVNCRPDTTLTDVEHWLRLAHQEGCLGLTIYRDGSRQGQPVSRV
ncbi:hypothetical protein [Pyxidicoccus caerfyrddinensis]|uniref:hypothetical protein n=1 Tax=Pyxidicoccus caerfyrddinensis TaxID=2709663 RepID=UPI0013DA87F2|nr:hypothetical protein [Pyxidicoccus caerfyrddinensis]